MRILQLHVDFIEYQPIEKEIKLAEESEKKKVRLEDIVVLFTAMEDSDNESVVKSAVKEIKSSLEVLKVNKVLIYPYAHLSSNLAKPSKALSLVKLMEKYSKEAKLETYRAPFGWNKQFSLKIKAHPLAEQSKEIIPGKKIKKEEEEIVSKALKEEEKIKSKWFILFPNGKMIPIRVEKGKIVSDEKLDLSKNKNLMKFALYEMAKSREVKEMPPHIRLMRELEIADFEKVSDPGNLRFYPKGRLIKSLIEQFVTKKTIEYGAMEMESPLMFNIEHPAVIEYLNKFPARQYIVKSGDKDYFLKFSACFGQFAMASDMTISYKHLPLRLYELTRYSFRREKEGELAGLRRLRAFTMPDVHAFCENIGQAMKEFQRRFKLCQDVIKGIGFEKEDYELAIRFTKDFYDKHKDFIMFLMKLHGKPALIEMWDKRAFYFILKYEFNFVDALDKAAALSTDQIDIENAERYKITYIDKKGKKKYPIILHCSPSGAIERDIYALLEKAYMMQKAGKVGEFPLWLSPIQVRIIPVSDDYVKFGEKILRDIEKENIRVDIDDRNMTVEKKIREAELEWVNLIIVVGEKEKKSKKLPVRIRKTGKIEKMNKNEVIKYVKERVKDYPFIKLSLPKYLTLRPKFVG